MIKATLYIDSIYCQCPVKVDIALPYPYFGERNYKNIWALHCALKDGSFFFDNLAVANYVDQYGLAVIAPSLNFFGALGEDGSYDFLENELFSIIMDTFQLSEKKEDNFLLGISMGAYESLKLIKRSKFQFSRIALLSGVYDFSLCDEKQIKKDRRQSMLFKLVTSNLKRKYGEDFIKTEAGNLLKFSDNCLKCNPKVDIYCGAEDFICIDNSKVLLDKLQSANIKCSFSVFSGGHETKVWQDSLEDFVKKISVKGDLG